MMNSVSVNPYQEIMIVQTSRFGPMRNCQSCLNPVWAECGRSEPGDPRHRANLDPDKFGAGDQTGGSIKSMQLLKAFDCTVYII